MALNPNESAAFGMFKAIKDSESVFGDTNKLEVTPSQEKRIPEAEYRSSMKDQDILDLVAQWRNDYQPYFDEIEPTQKKAFDYWLGKQQGKELTMKSSSSDPSPLVDNVIFTAVETFLPLATRANPDPVVTSDPSEDGQRISRAIHSTLVYEADRQKFRRKLARLLRRWNWDRLGVVKISWDFKLKQIKTDIIPAKRMIFDRDGYIDEGGIFRGEYVGEKKRDTAGNIITMFAKGDDELKKYIINKVKGKLASKIDYFEWWYRGRDLFFTLGNEKVLGKFKNPNWNYDIPANEFQEEKKDEEGNVIQEAKEASEGQQGINFHKEPLAPYIFLSIFSSGTHPYDETSLILQNIPLQDVLNRRFRQIDSNVQNMNEGLVVSGKSFTQDQAANAANALRKGQAIMVPDGDVRSAVAHIEAPGLPSDIYENMKDMRDEIMNVYGTAGSTPQGLEQQKTVRGKILVSQQDTSRIGGTITEQLEQVADTIYNFWVQFIFVYYDEEHFVTSSGMEGGLKLLGIKNTMFQLVKMLDITVKEGSLIPKDPLTKRNEAVDLWTQNAIDPISFFRRLDEPDPKKSAIQLVLWKMAMAGNMQAMQAYLPDLPIFLQQQLPNEQPGTGGPAVNPNMEAQNLVPQIPEAGSPIAVAQESKQLIQRVPIQ